MAEKSLAANIRIAAPKHNARMFRNQVGTYIMADPKCWSCQKHGRRISSGFGKDSPDQVGWQTVVVTPEMVGTKVAVFVGMELKTGKRKPTGGQYNWLKVIKDSGGIAGVVRTIEEAVAIFEGKE